MISSIVPTRNSDPAKAVEEDAAVMAYIKKHFIGPWVNQQDDPEKKHPPYPFYMSPQTLAAMCPDGVPDCRICLKEGHINCGCPYMDFCPMGTQVGDSYVVVCKYCSMPPRGTPRPGSCCSRQEGRAIVKTCFNNCGKSVGDHMTEDCPKWKDDELYNLPLQQRKAIFFSTPEYGEVDFLTFGQPECGRSGGPLTEDCPKLKETGF